MRALPTTDALPGAKSVVCETVRAWGLSDRLLQDAITVTGELIANAVTHACTPLELRLDCSPGRLRIEVADRDPRDPLLHTPGVGEAGHRGLVIVDALCARWGTRPERGGKSVWGELDTTVDGSGRPLPVEPPCPGEEPPR